MSMKPTMNRLIPLLGLIFLLISGVIVLNAFNRESNADVTLSEIPVASAPDIDTPADTVRSLSAQVAELLAQTRALTEENSQLRDINTDALAQEQRIEGRLRTELSAEMAQERTRKEKSEDSLLSTLTARIDQLSGKVSQTMPSEAPGFDDIPVGFGYGDGAAAGVHWIEPLGGAAGVPAATAANPPGSLLYPGGPGTALAGPASSAGLSATEAAPPVLSQIFLRSKQISLCLYNYATKA